MLLRLAGPMQAWGDESKYDIRQTRREPGKSGVIGLLAAALGLRRDSDQIPALNQALRMGVRVEAPGQVIHDFHTALPPKRTSKGEVRCDADGRMMMEPAPYVTHRYYLCDACFLVALESEDDALLARLAEALESPCFPLYLGRRSCPPVLPLYLGIRPGHLEETLRSEPWMGPEWYRKKHPAARLRLILETARGKAARFSLRDAPVSFSPVHRLYAPRGLEPEQYVMMNDGAHDPMRELETEEYTGDDEEHVSVANSD